MSKACETCPFYTQQFKGKNLRVCSNPSVACRDGLDNLYNALQTREELQVSSETAHREGIIPFLSVQENDVLDLQLMYSPTYTRKLTVKISEDSFDCLSAVVLHDDHNSLPEAEKNSKFALPKGTEITLSGAYDQNTGKTLSGELHRSRGISYRRDGEPYYTGGIIHEVVLIRGRLESNMFSTEQNEVYDPPKVY